MSSLNLEKSLEFTRLVEEERARQETLWGPQVHTAPEWVLILAEEFGEVAKACCKGWWTKDRPLTQMMTELVHVAAVAEGAYADLMSQQEGISDER